MNSDKKQRIMDAAEHLFRTRQFHEITLEEVAARAKVGKGTIYLYFADKPDLFFQTAVAGFDCMCDLLRTASPEPLAFRDDLLRTCQTIGDFFYQRRPLFRLILNEGTRVLGSGGALRDRWIKRRQLMTEAVAAVLARGIASGDIRLKLPPAVLAEFLLALLRARSWELADAAAAHRSHAVVVDLFLHGAGPPSANL